MELNGRKKVVRGDPVFTEFLHVVFRMKNRKMNFDFGPNFSGFFILLLLTNERASDGNISGAYTRGSKEDSKSVLKKIPYEHTSDLHCQYSGNLVSEHGAYCRIWHRFKKRWSSTQWSGWRESPGLFV